jgi:hypothetical protein
MKIFYFTQFQSSSDVTHFNVNSLGGNDFFFDGWNESYVGQRTLRNNLKTWLFWIATGSERLNHEMIAVLFHFRASATTFAFPG